MQRLLGDVGSGRLEHPHISLIAADGDEAALIEACAALASELRAFVVDLARVSTFPGDEGVVFVALRTRTRCAMRTSVC
ncbi:MAG TPA: hypothetical protein VFX59_10940 [Polyangiales bacterium]|nr:hypothetical protein [Polyangiales bacterium]